MKYPSDIQISDPDAFFFFETTLLSCSPGNKKFVQERYWRIPGTWQANDLRKRIVLIKSGLENNATDGKFFININSLRFNSFAIE